MPIQQTRKTVVEERTEKQTKLIHSVKLQITQKSLRSGKSWPARNSDGMLSIPYGETDKKKVKQPRAGTQEPVKEQPGDGTQGQLQAEQTALEQVTCESDVKQEKDTMSATVKLAKEVDDPDKMRIEGESVNADEKNTDGNKGPDEIFDLRRRH